MFLDEISEMSAPLQSKLLQVLQDGEFARLGGRQDVRVDVRVVAATNRDLESAVQDGQFREDLFFRLNVVCITLPPLRQRRDEIRPLTEHFLARYCGHYNKPPLAIAAAGAGGAPAGQAPREPLKAIGRSAAGEAEPELIYRTLQHTRWNRREAAEILGISYKALLYKIKDAELDRAS